MDTPGIRLLLIEDDEVIREATTLGLSRLGYLVEGVGDGLEGLERFKALQSTNPVDAVLLDVMLPTMNGTQVCHALRRLSSVPVIMVSARGDGIDMVNGLDAGADDYLAKPFDLQVLDARLRAVLRRTRELVPRPATAHAEAERPKTPGSGLDIDPHRLSVTLDGQEVRLTPTEMRILLLLSQDPGGVVSRTEILTEVWGHGWDSDQRVIDVHVQRLRRKIGAAHVETVRGFGYRLDG